MKKSIDNPIVKRILIALNLKKPIDIARLKDITQQNLNGYIKRETLIELVEHELFEKNINLNWIKTGEGEMLLNKAAGQYVENLSEAVSNHSTNNIQSPYPDSNFPALQKTSEVLETDSIFQKALNSNIEAFHAAIKIRSELNMTKIKLNQCERKIEKQQNDINDLKVEIESLKERLLITESK